MARTNIRAVHLFSVFFVQALDVHMCVEIMSPIFPYSLAEVYNTTRTRTSSALRFLPISVVKSFMRVTK